MSSRRARKPAENSGKTRSKRKGHHASATSFKPGNPWRFKPGESGNPGGRPKLLSDAYREWLAAEDEGGVTNAAKVALKTGATALKGDVKAVREIRTATEGTKLVTWKDEIVIALRDGTLTPDELRAELGEDANELLVAAGVAGDEGVEAAAKGPAPEGPAAGGPASPGAAA